MSAIDPTVSGSPRAVMTVHIESDFEPLLGKFMTNRKNEVGVMRDALAQHDLDTVRKVAHGMKGAGGSYGFDHISALAASIEHAAKTGVPAGIGETLDQLATYLDRVHVVFD